MSALLAPCAGTPLTKVNNFDFFRIKEDDEQMVELPVIWDAIPPVWNHHDVASQHVL